MLFKASVMVGCRDAILTTWGEGPSGRVSQDDAKMSRQRVAMERSVAAGSMILGLKGASPRGL